MDKSMKVLLQGKLSDIDRNINLISEVLNDIQGEHISSQQIEKINELILEIKVSHALATIGVNGS